MSTLSSGEANRAVGRRLAALRASEDLSQSAFAERIGVSVRAYQNWERGEREIPAVMLNVLYDEFRVDPMWILAGPGEQPLSADERPKPQLVEEVVLAVEQWLQRRRKTLPPAKKARLMRLLYEHFLAKGEVEPDHVNEMLLLAA